MTYAYSDGREATFDIHTSWVTPDNFPGYVEQEVQFRFDNGVWNAHQRKRGVEWTVEGRSPGEFKYTPNHHYNAAFIEPWGERSQRGYGLEVIRRFFEEIAFVEFGGSADGRGERLRQMRALAYNDLIGRPAGDGDGASDGSDPATTCRRTARLQVIVNGPRGGLVLQTPGETTPIVLYEAAV